MERTKTVAATAASGGHNRTDCPEVAKDWAWWKNFGSSRLWAPIGEAEIIQSVGRMCTRLS